MNSIHPKHTAWVPLHEARARRVTAFSHVLLRWAGNARRRAAETAPIPTTHAQQELFL